jgi:hypothetical protein
LARVRFGAANVGPGTCTVWYNATNGSVAILNDAGTVWATSAFGAGTLQNSQCSLDLAASSATPSGSNLTLALRITFAPSFAGVKNVYMLAGSAGGTNTGWLTRGTWTPYPAGGPPVLSATSVSPNAGSGSSSLFALQYSDSLGAADLASARVRFGAANVGPNTCTIGYNAATGMASLLDDAGTAWASAALGGAGVLENSQCALTLGGSSASPSGNNLTVNLAVLFKAAFIGPKNIYMLALSAGGTNTGWAQRGTFNVTAPPSAAGTWSGTTLHGHPIDFVINAAGTVTSFVSYVSVFGTCSGTPQISGTGTLTGSTLSISAAAVGVPGVVSVSGTVSGNTASGSISLTGIPGCPGFFSTNWTATK